MKTFKKALSIFLCLAMMFTCLAGMQISVAAEDTTAALALSVGEATVADGVVTVPVVVDSNTGFQALTATVEYDNTVLTLASAEKATISDVTDNAVFGPTTANPFKMMWAFSEATENVTATGTIATLTFNVVEGAEVDTTAINLEVTEAWDVDGNAVTATATDGTVDLVEEEECAHEWEVTEATPATYDDSHAETAKGSITFTCGLCDKTTTEEVSYYRYYACATTNAVYESEIQFQLNARDNHLEKQGEYEDGFIKITKSYESGATDVTYSAIADAEQTTKSGYACRTWTIGVPSKELTDNINANVYVKFNGAWYSGQATNKTVEEYALSVLAGTSTEDSEKTLVANMLTYGAKMQIFKSYNLDKLADANLGDYSSYVTTTVPTAENTSSNPYDTSRSEVIFNKFSLDMGSKVSIVYNFRTDFYTDGSLDDLKIVCSYETAEGDMSTTYTEDAETDAYSLTSGYTNRYNFYYDKLPAKRMRTSVNAIAYNGDEVVSYTNIHSIESLVAILLSDSNVSEAEKDVYRAMLNYGDAAAAHFGI